MRDATNVIHEFDTDYGHYQVIDMVYDGRPARVLFSGQQRAAQSGLATDDNSDLIFDYNQRMYELATGLAPTRILSIGGGMFTLPMALLEALPDCHIDVVELDTGLQSIARQYFGLRDDARLRIHDDDGLSFLAANTATYDMILIDAYTHDSAEPTLGNAEAIGYMINALAPDGLVAANVIAAYFGRRSQALRRLIRLYEDQFKVVELFPASQSLSLWLPQNLLLVAQRDASTPVEEQLRHSRLQLAGQPFNIGRDLRL
jgi:spermidine synthase